MINDEITFHKPRPPLAWIMCQEKKFLLILLKKLDSFSGEKCSSESKKYLPKYVLKKKELATTKELFLSTSSVFEQLIKSI